MPTEIPQRRVGRGAPLLPHPPPGSPLPQDRPLLLHPAFRAHLVGRRERHRLPPVYGSALRRTPRRTGLSRPPGDHQAPRRTRGEGVLQVVAKERLSETGPVEGAKAQEPRATPQTRTDGGGDPFACPRTPALLRPLAQSPIQYHPAERRAFHRDRTTAVIMVLLDTARRIGEALHLRVEDSRAAEREIAKTQSKGRRPRVISVERRKARLAGCARPVCCARPQPWITRRLLSSSEISLAFRPFVSTPCTLSIVAEGGGRRKRLTTSPLPRFLDKSSQPVIRCRWQGRSCPPSF